MPNYLTEFPDFGTLDFDPSSIGFTDDSWHNDVCPSFVRGDLKLWVDYADIDRRETGNSRYTLCLMDGDGQCIEDLFETEEISLIIERIKSC